MRPAHKLTTHVMILTGMRRMPKKCIYWRFMRLSPCSAVNVAHRINKRLGSAR